MKKVLAFLMAVAIMLSICACKKTEAGDKTSTTEKTTSVEEGKYVLKSDEKQKVYKNQNNYMIFYFEGEKVSAINTVLTFATEKAAESSLQVLKKSENKSWGSIAREGKYVVINMTEAYLKDYNEMTAQGREDYLRTQGYIIVEKAPVSTTAATTAKQTEKSTAKATEKTSPAAK